MVQETQLLLAKVKYIGEDENVHEDSCFVSAKSIPDAIDVVKENMGDFNDFEIVAIEVLPYTLLCK